MIHTWKYKNGWITEYDDGNQNRRATKPLKVKAQLKFGHGATAYVDCKSVHAAKCWITNWSRNNSDIVLDGK